MTKSPSTGPVATSQKAEATRRRILKAAQKEFSRHGYQGARVDRICRAAKINIRMIYHYFGSKEKLYLRVLEETYMGIRTLERSLDYEGLSPAEAIEQLISVTFDFLASDPHFVRMIMNENLMLGAMAHKSRLIPETTRNLVRDLETILRRGQNDGTFCKNIAAVHLYITILGLCFIHVSNRHTLANMFQFDLSDPAWLEGRKQTVTQTVIAYLTSKS